MFGQALSHVTAVDNRVELVNTSVNALQTNFLVSCCHFQYLSVCDLFFFSSV